MSQGNKGTVTGLREVLGSRFSGNIGRLTNRYGEVRTPWDSRRMGIVTRVPMGTRVSRGSRPRLVSLDGTWPYLGPRQNLLPSQGPEDQRRRSEEGSRLKTDDETVSRRTRRRRKTTCITSEKSLTS